MHERDGKVGLAQLLAFLEIKVILPRLQLTRTYSKQCFNAKLKISQRIKMLKLRNPYF